MNKVEDVSNAIERYDRSPLFTQVKQLKLKLEEKQDSHKEFKRNFFSSFTFTAAH